MRIAKAVLEGRAAMLEHRPADAVKAYRTAAKIETSKVLTHFDDPPVWWYPTERSLAAALLAAGDAKQALAQANAALTRRPRDPVSLSVRADALTALGQTAAAEKDRAAAVARWHGDKSAFTAALI